MTSNRLTGNAHIGGVRLQVADLGRSSAFYGGVLGFTERSRSAGRVEFGPPGGDRALVQLVERPGATPVPPQRRLGLFHFAILLPDRPSLARALVHLNSKAVPLGMSDHLVSEALYLSDPDGLGIEIYRDRPRAEWKHDGAELAMASDPLDMEGLIREAGAGAWAGMPPGTTIGHMHLHVGDLARAEAFYCAAIGFDVTVRRYPGALFMSAGGYHHHLGTNTWARGAPAPQADEAQLLHWELVVSGPEEVAAIGQRLRDSGAPIDGTDAHSVTARDPFGTAVRVVALPG